MEELKIFIEEFKPDQAKQGDVYFLNDFDDLLSKNQEMDKDIMHFLWKEYGTCSFNNGLLWLINPHEYADLVRKFDDVSDNAIPILRTATGSFLIWNYLHEEWMLTYLDVNTNECDHKSDDMLWFFEDELPLEEYWEDDLNGEIEQLSIQNFANLSENECIGFINPITQTGTEELSNMERINHKIYLEKLLAVHNLNHSNTSISQG